MAPSGLRAVAPALAVVLFFASMMSEGDGCGYSEAGHVKVQ